MANMLLTGGRSFATLELARNFHAAGYSVFLAESIRGSLSAPSRALQANFLVPPPRQQPQEFIRALLDIIRQNRIDLLIPTGEETFCVARHRTELSADCTVFVDSLDNLRTLHNKATFIQTAQELGLSVPQTCLVETQAQMSEAFTRWPRLVLKPVYSRFASHILILPSRRQAEIAFQKNTSSAWVAQEFIAGSHICTYSVAHQGHLTAHCAYHSEFKFGRGSTILFQPADHPAAFAWVKQFVAARRYTGQIAFDFIETPQDELLALECNPRATSGIHLFAGQPGFHEAYTNPAFPCLVPLTGNSFMVLSAMLLFGLPCALQKREFKHWLAAFTRSRDVIFSARDPLPALLQLRSALYFAYLGRRHGISISEATTFDIEWNGE
jgi:predicted ATP-grasp superfamily ATP-dependent carboligase